MSCVNVLTRLAVPDAILLSMKTVIIIHRNYWLLILAAVVKQVFKGPVFSTLISQGYLGAGCRR